MYNLLLDSDILINILRGTDSSYVKILDGLDLYISVVTYGEIVYGQRKLGNLTREKDLHDLIYDFNIEVIPLSVAEISSYIDLRLELERQGNSIPDADLHIAATAVTHNLTLYTLNKKHFNRIKGLSLL